MATDTDLKVNISASVLKVKIETRSHNERLVRFLVWLLGLVARPPLMKAKTAVRLANRIIKLYRLEYRIPGGDWQHVDPGHIELADGPGRP